jgi:hypothetical protein
MNDDDSEVLRYYQEEVMHPERNVDGLPIPLHRFRAARQRLVGHDILILHNGRYVLTKPLQSDDESSTS